MAIIKTISVTTDARRERYELDGVELRGSRYPEGTLDRGKPLSMALLQDAIRQMKANCGRTPDFVAVSKAQLDAIEEAYAPEVTKTSEEE